MVQSSRLDIAIPVYYAHVYCLETENGRRSLEGVESHP